MRRAALIASLLVVVTCGGTPPPPQQHMAPAPAPAGPLAAVVSARNAALQQPGALSAYQLANTIHAYAKAGHYANRGALLQQDANDAIARLSAAPAMAADDQAMLATWRGILYGDLGNREMAIEELNHSLSVAPSNLAAGTLVTHFALAGEMPSIFNTCKSVAPILRDPNEKYQLTQHCMKSSRAISQAGALAWAPPAHVDWYHAETVRRQQSHAAQQQQQAAIQQQQQQQQAIQQQQAARERSNNAVATYACSQECRETGYDCQSECNGNGACEFGCSSRRDRCLRACKK